MRILLVDPEDSPLRGPWASQPWDLIVDLGNSSFFSEESWRQRCNCRIVRSQSVERGIADAREVRKIFSAGRGRLLDEEGIDWWDLTSLLFAPEVFALLRLGRVAGEINPDADLWATRPGNSLRLLEGMLNRPVQRFGDEAFSRIATRAGHYAGLLRRFSAAQFKEIVLDKYDSGYQWRARFAQRPKRCAESVVLLPSAYGNASRMAAAYAQLLPSQPFLMVATRQSARRFEAPAGVEVRDLASYASGNSPQSETASLVDRWIELRDELQDIPEYRLLFCAGVLNPIHGWIRDGVSARTAWRRVLQTEPVRGVLCGDDSNLYTRLPVLLAARRGIPTVDFHHGALDGRYLLKELPCDWYLAKNEMERDYLLRTCGLSAEKVMIGAPKQSAAVQFESRSSESAILFSEPYEVAGMRAEEVYRELLPGLCRLARANGGNVIVKLHPFESRAQRERIVSEILSSEDQAIVRVMEGPLSKELLSQAWFGITIESTTVIDCMRNGICCFLCGWLSLSSYEYGRQYARFGIGEVLQRADQIEDIPRRLDDFHHRSTVGFDLSPTVDPAMLQQWLTSREPFRARSAS